MKLDNGTQCDPNDVRVWRQRRETGIGCLVSVPATDNADGAAPSRDYFWSPGYPVAAHEMHPQAK